MGRAVLLLVSCVALLLPAAGSGSRTASLDLVLRATRTPSSSDLARSIGIVTHRAELLGGSGIEVKKRGSREISVHIASIDDAARAKALLASRGQLAFYDFETHVNGRPTRKPPKTRLVLRCGGGASACPGVSASPVKRWVFYAAKGRPELTGADVVRGQTRADHDPQTEQPVVLIQLTNRGQLAFLRATAAEAKRGKQRWASAGRAGPAASYFQHFAIVIDDRILSVPSIDFQQYPSGISAVNGIQITGLRGAAEAKSLALLLKSGTLPVPFAVRR